MPASSAYQWVVLAEKFPCGLANFPPATEIGPGFTPAATGLDANAEGYLKTGAVPTGATRTVVTYTVGGDTYEWHFRRLWRISTNKLIYGALDYTAVYYRQGRGEIDLPEATTILKMIPVGTSLVLMSADGSFVLSNANDPGANFRQLDLVQEAKLTDAARAVELNGVLYFTNADGFFAMNPDGEVLELSKAVDGDTTFQNVALTCDYANQYVVFGTTGAYDPGAKKFFEYDGTTFLYQSPMLRQPSGEPFACRAVMFHVEHNPADQTEKAITLSTRFGGRDWTEAVSVAAPYAREKRDAIIHNLDVVESARTFDLKLTDLPAGLWIKRIMVEVAGFTQRSRED